MAEFVKVPSADGKSVRWKMKVFVGRVPELDPETGEPKVDAKTGKPKIKRKYIIETFDRKKDAEAEARRLEGTKDKGALTAPSKEPLAKYLQTWLDDVKEGRIRTRTLYDYRGIVDRYIKDPPEGMPAIGMIRLHRLTPAAFQNLYAYMWKDLELSPRTIRYLHTILRQALGHAVLTGALARNPTDAVKPPTQERPKDAEPEGQEKAVRAMLEEEAGRFKEAAREDRYYALWVLLLTGGLRPGEALALGWPDVNLEEGRVHVRRSITRRGVEGWKFVEPKTKKARRVVVLPSVAVQALKEWRTAQAKEKLLLGAEYEDNGLVFATEFGKALDPGNLSSRNFRRIMAAAKLGEWETVSVGGRVKKETRRFRPAFRVYDLRHTCATLLLKGGVNAKIVQERLGHASITLTLDTYSHVLPDMQEGAADALEAMFGSA